jgi:hypothetical protein
MFKPTLWNAAVRHRLYLPACDVMDNAVCQCGLSSSNTRSVQPFSAQPAHFHVCDMMKGHMKQRHDLLKFTMQRLLRELGAHVMVEPELQRSSDAAVQCMRADLCVTTASGKKYVDLSIVCPAGQEFVNVHRSDKHPLKSAEVAAKEKRLKYTGKLPLDCTDADFVPCVLETYGGMNAEGTSWLKSVCTELSSTPAASLDHVLNVVSACLQMGNGQLDVTGCMLHRASNRGAGQSQRDWNQTQVMYLLQQYVCGGVRLDWLAEQRTRVAPGRMREVAEVEAGAA